MDVSKQPSLSLTGSTTTMTFSKEDGSHVTLKMVEREVKEGDKPAMKACQVYLDGKTIKHGVDGPVDGEAEFDQIWRETLKKMNFDEEWTKAALDKAATVEVQEEEVAGSEDDLDLKRSLTAVAQEMKELRDSGAVMTRGRKSTIHAKLYEEPEDRQEDIQKAKKPKSNQRFMKMLRKLSPNGKKEKRRRSKKSETEEKEEEGSTKDASTNTKVALELKDVSERFHN